MSAVHLGHYNTATSRTHVRFQFSTHEAAGGNVAPSSAFEAADLRIYRAADGAAFSATQRSSANGITMTSPFDTLTGVHDVDIDLTDNTDASFYAAGYLYSVVLAPDETIASQTITGVVLAYFEIGPPQVNATQWAGTSITATSLPVATAAGASGGLLISGSNSGTTTFGALTVSGATTLAAVSMTTLTASGAVAFQSTFGVTGTTTLAALTCTTLTATTNAVPWNASWDAEVQSEVEDALVVHRLDELLNADSDIDGAAPPTVGSVFHELLSKTAGSFTFDQTTDSLEAIRDRGDAAWITATSVTVSDKTGFSLVSTGLDLVTTWTVAITGNITGNLSGSVGSVTGAVGSVTGNVGGNVTGSVGSLATQAKADVNTEVLDVLNTDTFAEPGQEAPGATVSLVKKISYLYKAWRNKSTQDATDYNLYADDATTVDQNATTSDDGTTFTRGEVGTGP